MSKCTNLGAALLSVCLLFFSFAAVAVPISGTATIIGTHTIDGSNLTNNTQFDFTGSLVSPAGGGDLAAFVAGASVTLSVDPWTFTPGFASHLPFLTLTNGGSSAVFDLDTSLTIVDRSGNNINSALTLYLLGTLTPSGPAFVGLDPSAASITFAATAAGTNGGFTMSLAAPPAQAPPTGVPEPATLMLLGVGLIASRLLFRGKAVLS